MCFLKKTAWWVRIPRLSLPVNLKKKGKKKMKQEDYLMIAITLMMMILLAVISSIPVAETQIDMRAQIEEDAERHSLSELNKEPVSRELVRFENETTEDVKTQRFYPTLEEFELMARVVMSEAGGEDFECQLAVAQTIINRIESDKFPNSVSEVIYQPNQYSVANNGEPTDSVMEAVQTACEDLYDPADMYYFRDGYYHEFARDYAKYGNMYFSREAVKE